MPIDVNAVFLAARKKLGLNRKRRHHYVWQHYLAAWAQAGQLSCYMDGRIFRSSTLGLGIETDLYRVAKITKGEIDFIKKYIISDSNPDAKRLHENFISYFALASALYGRSSQIDDYLDLYGSNVIENFHSEIESKFIPILAQIKDGNLDFYKSTTECLDLFNFISHQYMRTNGMKSKVVTSVKQTTGHDCSNVWPLISHIFSVNIGGGLFVERRDRSLTLIENSTSTHFITGDQPVINLHARFGTPVDKATIYYPVSPRLALLLSEKSEHPLYQTSTLDDAKVHDLNGLIFANSHRQIYGDSPDILKRFESSSDPGA